MPYGMVVANIPAFIPLVYAQGMFENCTNYSH